MLSPKASTADAFNFSAGCTVTGNAQLAVRLWASVAVQVTVVLPSGNDAPMSGVQVVVTGVAPPVVDGFG